MNFKLKKGQLELALRRAGGEPPWSGQRPEEI